MSDKKPEHQGDFAEGEADTHVEPGSLMGDFAAGQDAASRAPKVEPRGDFATGEEKEPIDPTALRGDFARGQEKVSRE